MNINSDASELEKFESLGQNWWNRHGEFKALHDINPLRLCFIQKYAQLTGKNIIDVGCGGGILAESLAQLGAKVTGIDLSQTSLATAQTHAQQTQLTINYQCIAAEAMAQQHPQQFDTVTCMELLEHVPNPAALIQACATLLKPHGEAFFSTLNRNAKSYLHAILGAEYILKLVPKGTHNFAKFIRPSELDSWARTANLELQAMTGIAYNPFTQQYKLTNNVSVNYLVYCQKIL
ncbi:MAG: bifunctional 2-polyprenyl-6-hydroxyphenol methylase/3-demethylubiquinol 3-O-methyltransferase UbiG [Gammaproteobacteria bacterium]|nr:bifunctional 2-polyprenyl-6-hydroxyphenol methylase/3-demethylubiquinol 3-O-methyltransferase UbiG [Gammaproteobacteria bacterium]